MRLQHLAFCPSPGKLSTIFTCIGQSTRAKLVRLIHDNGDTPDKVSVKHISHGAVELAVKSGVKRIFIRWGLTGPDWVSEDMPPDEAERVKAARAALDVVLKLVSNPTAAVTVTVTVAPIRYHRLARWPTKTETAALFLIRGKSLRAAYAAHLAQMGQDVSNLDRVMEANLLAIGAEQLYVWWGDSGWVTSPTPKPRQAFDEASLGAGLDDDDGAYVGPELKTPTNLGPDIDDGDEPWVPPKSLSTDHG